MSEEHRLAISNSLKGHTTSEETKIKIGNANRGRKPIMSQETCDKISQALKGKMPKFIPNNKGRKHTPEHTQNWLKSRIKSGGFKWGHHSEESKRKISESNYRGENIGYGRLHLWVNNNKRKKGLCSFCGIQKNTDWANKSHKYLRNLDDWLELCRKCHINYDKNYKGVATKKYGEKQINGYR